MEIPTVKRCCSCGIHVIPTEKVDVIRCPLCGGALVVVDRPVPGMEYHPSTVVVPEVRGQLELVPGDV